MYKKIQGLVGRATLIWVKDPGGYPFTEAKKFERQILTNLLGVDPEALRTNHSLRYLFHLKDVAGLVSAEPVVCQQDSCVVKQAQNMEGWFASNFLPMRIGSLFKIAVKVNSDRIPNAALPEDKPLLLDHLICEIAVEMKTYQLARRAGALGVKVQQYASAPAAQAGIQREYSALIDQFNQKFCPELVQNILDLKPGEELTMPSGSLGHCVYVTFWARSEREIGIRVDNAGLWSDKHPIDPAGYVRPYVITLLQREDEETWMPALMEYLGSIFCASSRPEEEAEELIYNHPFNSIYAYHPRELQAITANWTPVKQQNVGNCVVKSHEIGFQKRLGTLVQWIRDEEVSLAAVDL
jgi:hypothetical protein